jgi:probable F420-dependent oxidoreductase
MNLGFGLLSAQRRQDSDDWSDAYRETLELAVDAERLGFSSVWTTEHHFVDDGYMPSLLVVSAALATVTTSIEIGTGVLLAPLHDPIRLAEDAATVQLISGGRLTLGLGIGWNPIEFAGLRTRLDQRGRAMDEILEILPKAWSGEPFQHTGEVYELPMLGVRPTPHRPIPVIMGGSAEAAVRRAARSADGFFGNRPADTYVTQVRWAIEELERTGRDPAAFRFVHYSAIFPTDTEETGWAEAEEHIRNMEWKYEDMEASATRSGSIHVAPPMDRSELSALKHTDALVGPPELIVERLLSLRERAGVPVEFVARSYFHTLEHVRQRELMQRVAEEIGPHL